MSLQEKPINGQTSLADLRAELAQAERELAEARAHQAATAEVLKVISGSNFDLTTVLDKLIDSACRLCEADIGTIRYEDGAGYRLAATYGCLPEWRALFASYSNKPQPGSVFGQTILKGGTVHIPDLLDDPDYARPEAQKMMGLRTALGVPLVRQGRVFGVVIMFRTTPRPFTQTQMALAETFADQAAIAIENARLLSELRESLERQTATSDVLRVISASPGELEPVFRTMLENATRICEAKFGTLYLHEDGAFSAAAMHNVPPAFIEARRAVPVVRPSPDNPMALVASTKRPVQAADVPDNPAWPRHEPQFALFAKLTGARSLVCVPMLKDNAVVGVITVYREEVSPFTEKQTELLTNFAAQAVIAIENARLLSELRQSLEQQTATADVLAVINASRGDLQPVFEAMVEKARRLCEADAGHLALPVGDDFRSVAVSAMSPEMEVVIRSVSYAPGRGTAIGRALEECRPVQISDIGTDNDHAARHAADKGFIRTILGVPLLREGEAIGAFGLSRRRVEPFSDRQIELVRAFADQAVIAIENTRLLNELRDSLEQQTATSDVLKVISSSPGSLEPVFDAMLENAVRICHAQFGVMHRFVGEEFGAVAMRNIPPPLEKFLRERGVAKSIPGTDMDKLSRTKQVVHTIDMLASPSPAPPAKLAGGRTQLAVPMLKDDELVGAIVIYRQEVLPFTDKQIELLTNFAAQAVIAIENARLLSELRQRTDDLTESLEQQTATSNVLKVISSSPGDLGPVFEAVLGNATRICGAKFGTLYLTDGDGFRAAAFHNAPRAFVEERTGKILHPGPESTLGRVARTKTAASILDSTKGSAYLDRDPFAVAGTELGGYRTILSVPMLHEDTLVGVIGIYRQEVRPFTEKQTELLTNFAAQAVIAIENARLLSELRESLERQTATSEVLGVISSSPGELEPVFQSMLRNATRLCGANFASLFRFENGRPQLMSSLNVPPAVGEFLRSGPAMTPSNAFSRMLASRKALQIADYRADEAYLGKDPMAVGGVELGGIRTLLIVPMVKDDAIIGAFGIFKQEVSPFTDKEIDLVSSFAAQAVIAIENARLLNELRDSLERQTATSEVLQVISSSPGELKPVFEAILNNAVRICGANFGTLYLTEGNRCCVAALHNAPPEFADFQSRRGWFYPTPGAMLERAMLTKRVCYSADAAAEFAAGNSVKLGGARSMVHVPMLKDDNLVGTIVIYRQEVRHFTDKQVALLENFAAQAVIAIENARLLNELRQRTDDLTESLQQQTATSDILEVISNSPTDSQPAFDAIVRSGLKLFPDAVVAISLPEGDQVRLAALAGPDASDLEALRTRYPMPLSRQFITATALLDGREMDFADAQEAPEHLIPGRQNFLASGYRAMTVMPMMRGEAAIGAVSVIHRRPRQLTDKQRELLRTFASQAVIAIENTRLFNELRESLDQQTATSEVLKVVSSSPGELAPVFSAMLENATRICGATFGSLVIYDGANFRRVAAHNAPAALREDWKRTDVIDLSKSATLRPMLSERHVFHILDLGEKFPQDPLHRLAGARTFLAVPMLKEGELIGVIGIYRQEVQAFSDKQIELVQNFAAQAVIAIENTRLLNELRQRTDDLTESLEQQTASGEILASISGSMADTKPVFGAIVRNLKRLFGTRFSMVQILEDGMVHLAATGQEDEYELMSKNYPRPLDGTQAPDRAMIARQTMQFVPVVDNPECPPHMQALARRLGFNGAIFAPMLRDGKVIGVIAVARDEAKLFTEKQVDLIKTFAAQAVIAIENTRLFNELRETLERQTATSEVLKVISTSPGELAPVFDAMLENATRICEAKFGTLLLCEDDALRAVALHGGREAYAEERRRNPLFRPAPNVPVARAIRTRQVQHIADLRAEPAYIDRDAAIVTMVESAGARTFLAVPMLKDDEAVGAVIIYRQEVRPFTDKQIELVQNFAAQAVIAIENTRLLNELRERTDDLTESLEQQTATSEVLSVMSRSKFDLTPILQSVVDTAARLCRAEQAGIFRLEKGVYRFAAAHYLDAKYLEFEKVTPYVPGPATVIGRAAMTRTVAAIDDVLADPLYEQKGEAEAANIRSAIGVPLMREGEAIGVIALARGRVEPFSAREIELVTTFADQAVIAIENVRLFDEVQARTEELSESLEQQTATADVLKVISRSTFDLQTVLDTLIESAARLCRADRVALRLLREGAYHTVALHGYSPEHDAYMKSHPTTAEQSSLAGRVVSAAKPVQIEDVTVHPDLTLLRSSPGFGVVRTLLGVPLLREGAPIGVLVLSRERVEPFTEKQIELVATFADQAVIAIENVRLFDEIQEKSRQLEEASKHKSQFLANMSHELRTPLNAILGYTELIADGVYGETPEKVQATVQRIITNGKHLLGLINDVLDLSKIEAGQLSLSLTDYSMKDVVYAVYGAVEPLAAEKKLNFKAEIAPDMAVGHGDERRLTQVLLNLVGNAIKFTDAGAVVIKASQSDGVFSVAVHDTGPGISEDDQKKLFQEFQQADSSTTKKKGGTGLGLAISKKIVEMHGGRIWLESQVGRGSTFAFTVPTRAEQQKRQA